MHTKGLVLAFALGGCSWFQSTPTPVSQHTALPPPAAVAPVMDSTQSARGISDAQTVLARENFYHGKVDGKWGPATEQALRDYQTAHNLPVTGKLNDETWNALNTKPQ